jgi:tRNA(fMet)-specific endonuclease VapC
MALFVLDTDHVSLLQRGHPLILEHLARVEERDIATAIVTYEEQLRGRLAVVHQAKLPQKLVLAYLRLHEMQEFFCTIRLLDFDPSAGQLFTAFRQAHPKLGTMDLRIAATAKAHSATLVTRNRRDFGQITGLSVEDWTVR